MAFGGKWWFIAGVNITGLNHADYGPVPGGSVMGAARTF
jgi:hypothetical protein